MYSTALPVTLPPSAAPYRHALLGEASLLRLYDAFACVPDPRSRHGRRYSLPFLLTCLVAALLCNCTHREAVGQEVVYLITSLSPDQAGPCRLLELVRGHWHIENGLQSVRDVTFGEDRSRIRSGHTPQVMAALRNLMITLLHCSGSAQIAACRRSLAFYPRHAFSLLLHKRSSP